MTSVRLKAIEQTRERVRAQERGEAKFARRKMPDATGSAYQS